MQLQKFIEKFNSNIKKIGSDLEIKEIKSDEKGNCKSLIITKDIAMTSYEEENLLAGMIIIGGGKTVQDSIQILKVISLAIDSYAEQNQEWRNSVLERLGMFNGKFAFGKTTESRGYKFKIHSVKGKIMLSINKI
ncbi:hypothetical protein [Natronincola ferrireducens]|uniref:Uncharacterized protein n=1 Tax=Natronincola ferrireducens TaxID=393762 RepID=A0A1G9I5S4_9FIRM|nr:hypothetical protein [Natronincola ferrireducens]SDL20452.1 hypothetical protein SAMN05660472_02804 [Natronincola ferrireducens]